MDEILTEDMGDMYKLFPYEVGVGVDLEGNPRNAPNLTACYI